MRLKGYVAHSKCPWFSVGEATSEGTSAGASAAGRARSPDPHFGMFPSGF